MCIIHNDMFGERERKVENRDIKIEGKNDDIKTNLGTFYLMSLNRIYESVYYFSNFSISLKLYQKIIIYTHIYAHTHNDLFLIPDSYA